MNATAATLGMTKASSSGRIATMPSTRVKPPRIADAAVAFECELAEIKPYPAEDPRQFLIFAKCCSATSTTR